MFGRANRSIFARVAAGAIAVSVIAALALLAVTWLTLEGQMRRSLEANTATDLAGLVDIYASGGRAELIARLRDRYALTGAKGRASHYMIATGEGDRIAGDVREWPALDPAVSEHGFVTVNGGTEVFARSAQLDEDLLLLVAREYGDDRAQMRRLAAVFLVAALAVVLAVWWLARRTSRGLARRIERINAGFREPAHAMPAPGGDPDEIDELAAHGTAMLARQARLAHLHKHMSDNVAHEVRTPLMHLDQSVVKALEAHPEPAGGPLTQAREDIRGMVALLDSLLDIASNEARRGDRAGLEDVDLSELVERLCELYEGSFEDAGLALKADIAPGVTMQGEPMQLSRLVSNLLDNAVKYVPPGGTVRLSLAPGPRIELADDGPGVPDDRREAIFQRFTRGDRADARGHGLGLALARAIAERHGLVLRLAQSERGASFVAEPA